MIGVVVPARDEQDRIGACLSALALARQRLAHVPDAPPVRVVVVADACTDATAELAATFPAVDVLVGDFRRVGRARAAGAAHLFSGPVRPHWLACTDADSQVPPDWLILQLEHLRAGTDLLLGTVRLDEADLLPRLLVRLDAEPDPADGHPHVYGAHFGVRAEIYLRAGGFADVAVHEDVLLAAAVRALGGVVVSSGRSPVVTSARLTGRTPGGLAGFLRARLLDPA